MVNNKFKVTALIGGIFIFLISCLSSDFIIELLTGISSESGKVFMVFLFLFGSSVGLVFVSIHYRNKYEELNEWGV